MRLRRSCSRLLIFLLLLLFLISNPASSISLRQGASDQDSRLLSQNHERRWSPVKNFGKAVVKGAKKAATAVVKGTKKAVAVASCLSRGSSSLQKDIEPLGWPAAPKSSCNNTKALATAREMVKNRGADGTFPCRDGTFKTTSVCMTQALGEADKTLALSRGQTLLMHDLYGGFLVHNMFDRDSLRGLGKCMGRFPTEVPAVPDMWSALKKGYGEMVSFWTPGFLSPELKDKMKQGGYKSCNALKGPYCMDVEAGADAWDNTTRMAALLKEMEAGAKTGRFYPPTMIRESRRHFPTWMEDNPTSIGEMRRWGGGGSGGGAPFGDDHPLKYMDDNIQLLQPCNALSALNYHDIALTACGLAPAAKSGPKFEYVRDIASIFSMLAWGNMVYHGSQRMGSTDVFPMNGMFHRMYEYTVDSLMTFPDTPQGRKDRHIVRDLPFLRKGCEMDMETCEDSSKYIRAFENLVAKDKSPKTWRMFTNLRISGVNKMDQPPYELTAALMMTVRLQAILHRDRVKGASQLWFKVIGLVGEKAGFKNESSTIVGEYAEALGRANMKCFKKDPPSPPSPTATTATTTTKPGGHQNEKKTSHSHKKHKCLDSLIMSRFNEWFYTLAQFPIALSFQEEFLGAAHFGDLHGKHKLPRKAADCSQMPHAMWHRKSGQFLDALVRQTFELPDLVTDQCKDTGDHIGNSFGLGSWSDLLFRSPDFKRGLTTLISMAPIGKEIKAAIEGLPWYQRWAAKAGKWAMTKDVGSTDLNGIWKLVEAAKGALHQQGRCDVVYGNPMGPEVAATSTCDCKRKPRPLFAANKPAENSTKLCDGGKRVAWETVWSKGEEVDAGPASAEAFNAKLDAAPNRIVRRLCPWCTISHREIYYKRLTPLNGFDAYRALGHTWTEKGNPKGTNKFKADFKLYSSYCDALEDKRAWQFCNFDGDNIGFPRDCGASTMATIAQWFTLLGPKAETMTESGVVFQIEGAVPGGGGGSSSAAVEKKGQNPAAGGGKTAKEAEKYEERRGGGGGGKQSTLRPKAS